MFEFKFVFTQKVQIFCQKMIFILSKNGFSTIYETYLVLNITCSFGCFREEIPKADRQLQMIKFVMVWSLYYSASSVASSSPSLNFEPITSKKEKKVIKIIFLTRHHLILHHSCTCIIILILQKVVARHS